MEKRTSSLADPAACHHQRRSTDKQKTAETDDWYRRAWMYDRMQPSDAASHSVSASQPAVIGKNDITTVKHRLT